jgi:hypothetical protein
MTWIASCANLIIEKTNSQSGETVIDVRPRTVFTFVRSSRSFAWAFLFDRLGELEYTQ